MNSASLSVFGASIQCASNDANSVSLCLRVGTRGSVEVMATGGGGSDLSELAIEKNVSVVCDMGVAPGLTHILAAAIREDLNQGVGAKEKGLDELIMYCGGLPLDPPPRFKHAVYFNARDLLALYIRPARVRLGGVNRDVHPLDYPVRQIRDRELGPLDCMASDGLRSILETYPDIRNMVEYTLRLPGHMDVMKTLREMGFMNGDAQTDKLAEVLRQTYSSRQYLDQLIFEVRGQKGNRSKAYSFRVLNRNGESAMQQSTGGTASAAAVMLASRQFHRAGVHPPERMGEDAELTRAMLDDLRQTGIVVEEQSRLTTIS